MELTWSHISSHMSIFVGGQGREPAISLSTHSHSLSLSLYTPSHTESKEERGKGGERFEANNN